MMTDGEAWRETAESMARDRDYYQSLVVKIGEALGKDAFIADDGSVMQDVLCAKVPELVTALQAENERLREALSEIDELTCGIDVSLGSLIDRVWTISSRALAEPTGGTE